jgi:site-specific DNA recombinase
MSRPRCAIYARYSSDLQSATSAEDQVRVCQERADREGWDVVDVYSDLAISGTSNRRPGMSEMLSAAARGSFEIVLSEALDRIARNQADIATIYQQLEFADVRIETLSEGAVNELHIGLKGTMGALFLKELGQKIRRGQRGAAERGSMPGGLCYGYDVVRELDAKGEPIKGKRAVNPEQAEVVRRIYREYAAGRSPKAIAKDLNRDGIPSARGGEWRASAIVGNRARMIGVLHNPIYAGRLVYNRVRMVRDPESRKRVSRPNKAAELQHIDMPDLRIVSDAEWQAVQDARHVRATQPLPLRRRPRHLVSGLVRCGLCDATMIMVVSGRLGCSRHREVGTCANTRRIAASELQHRVVDGLKKELLSEEAMRLVVSEYHAKRSQGAATSARERATLARRLQAAERAIANLVAAISAGAADFADIREALAAKTAERDAAREALDEAVAVNVVTLHPQIAEAYRARIQGLADSLGAGDANSEEVTAQIRDLIDVIYATPLESGEWQIEVVSRLQSVVALATGTDGPTRGRSRVTAMVAKEGLEPPTPGL